MPYKEVFPLIRDNRLWFGPSIHSGDRLFGITDNYPIKAAGWRVDDDGRKFVKVKGVPISFLDKYCPEQFEIVGQDRYVDDNPHYGHRFTLRKKETYPRILIRKHNQR